LTPEPVSRLLPRAVTEMVFVPLLMVAAPPGEQVAGAAAEVEHQVRPPSVPPPLTYIVLV